jgi:hypothetical protein
MCYVGKHLTDVCRTFAIFGLEREQRGHVKMVMKYRVLYNVKNYLINGAIIRLVKMFCPS